MKTVADITTELTRAFKESPDRNACGYVLPDGTNLALEICASHDRDIRNDGVGLDDFEWILVHGPAWTISMEGSPAQVAKHILDYNEIKAGHEEELRQLGEFCARHRDDPTPPCESDAYGFFSDWHKDVFGFRPKGWTMGVRRTA